MKSLPSFLGSALEHTAREAPASRLALARARASPHRSLINPRVNNVMQQAGGESLWKRGLALSP